MYTYVALLIGRKPRSTRTLMIEIEDVHTEIWQAIWSNMYCMEWASQLEYYLDLFIYFEVYAHRVVPQLQRLLQSKRPAGQKERLDTKTTLEKYVLLLTMSGYPTTSRSQQQTLRMHVDTSIENLKYSTWLTQHEGQNDADDCTTFMLGHSCT